MKYDETLKGFQNFSWKMPRYLLEFSAAYQKKFKMFSAELTKLLFLIK